MVVPYTDDSTGCCKDAIVSIEDKSFEWTNWGINLFRVRLRRRTQDVQSALEARRDRLR